MLSIGFEEDVERILENAPAERQTLLFSATMPTWVKKLTRRFQKQPITVDLVGDEEAGKMAETIRWVEFGVLSTCPILVSSSYFHVPPASSSIALQL